MNVIKAKDFKLKIFNDNSYYVFRGTYKDKTFIYRICWKQHYTRRIFTLNNIKNPQHELHSGSGIKSLIRNLYYNTNYRYGRKIYFRPDTYPVENFEIYEFNTEEELNEYIDRLNMLSQLVK